MTMFDIVVPLVALVIAAAGVAFFKFTDPMRKNPTAELTERTSAREAPQGQSLAEGALTANTRFDFTGDAERFAILNAGLVEAADAARARFDRLVDHLADLQTAAHDNDPAELDRIAACAINLLDVDFPTAAALIRDSRVDTGAASDDHVGDPDHGKQGV